MLQIREQRSWRGSANKESFELSDFLTWNYVSTIEWNISPWIQLNTFAIERDIIGRSCLRFSFFFFLSWSSTWYTTRIWMYIPHSSEVIYDFFIFMTRWAVLEFAFSSRFLTFQLLWILAGKIPNLLQSQLKKIKFEPDKYIQQQNVQKNGILYEGQFFTFIPFKNCLG